MISDIKSRSAWLLSAAVVAMESRRAFPSGVHLLSASVPEEERKDLVSSTFFLSRNLFSVFRWIITLSEGTSPAASFVP